MKNWKKWLSAGLLAAVLGAAGISAPATVSANAGYLPYDRIDNLAPEETMARVRVFSGSTEGEAARAWKKIDGVCYNGSGKKIDGAITRGIVELAKKYNASIYVDEAHGIGVFGRQGRGVCDHFGVTDDVDCIMGTFSKSFASLGGFVATDSVTANYLRHNSRSYIFSASITPASTAAVSAALDIIESEPERIQHLWDVTHYALDGFRRIGCEIGNTTTPIIPLFIRDNNKTFQVTRDLFEEGIFVNPVVSPAVPSEDTLIRFSLMATHTYEQVDFALEKIEKCFKKLDILK